MAKFVKIEQNTCIACGNCYAEAPEIFDELEDGITFVIADYNAGTEMIEEALYEDLDIAVDSCPTDSILVQNEAFN